MLQIKLHISQNSCFHNTVIRREKNSVTAPNQKVCGVKKKKRWRNPVNHVIGKIAGNTVKPYEEDSGREMEDHLGGGQPQEYMIVLKNLLSEWFPVFTDIFHFAF